MIKLCACLQLMRLPNTFTAMADVLAGYLMVRGWQIVWSELAGLLASTTCIYAAGCVLNDLHDLPVDRRDHPERPLPSGMVSRGEALALTAFLYLAGTGSAAAAGAVPLLAAVVLSALTMSYDLLLKDSTPFGQLNMAACRALNLVLGMSPALPVTGDILVFPLVSLVYVFYLTTLSRYEVGIAMQGRGWMASALFHLVFLVGLFLFMYRISAGFVLFFAVFTLVTGYPYIRRLLGAESAAVALTVKYLIIGIPLLDAVYVSGLHGPASGVPVALCFVPAILISRVFYVT